MFERLQHSFLKPAARTYWDTQQVECEAHEGKGVCGIRFLEPHEIPPNIMIYHPNLMNYQRTS